ncbi:transposase [uncultured Sphingomonas sp.]|uniref:transposase n=1 Tax=uncultured Sphingomonas sp. TaxID=158754 RepID=UPI00345C9AA5
MRISRLDLAATGRGNPPIKTSRFASSKQQAEDGTTVEEVCRKASISIQTYYRWRSKYGGLMPSELKRLKVLEQKNVRLKRLVANLSLNKEMRAKTSSAEKCRAWSRTGDRRRSAGELSG